MLLRGSRGTPAPPPPHPPPTTRSRSHRLASTGVHGGEGDRGKTRCRRQTDDALGMADAEGGERILMTEEGLTTTWCWFWFGGRGDVGQQPPPSKCMGPTVMFAIGRWQSNHREDINGDGGGPFSPTGMHSTFTGTPGTAGFADTRRAWDIGVGVAWIVLLATIGGGSAPAPLTRCDDRGGGEELSEEPVPVQMGGLSPELSRSFGDSLWMRNHSPSEYFSLCCISVRSSWRLRKTCRRQPNFSTPMARRSASVRLSRTGPLMAFSRSSATTSGGTGVESAHSQTSATVQFGSQRGRLRTGGGDLHARTLR